MRIEGYGEDSLTLAALRDLGVMSDILKVFSTTPGSSPVGSGRVFYRPSFGRGGRLKKNQMQVNFGEFDAIISMPGHIILVESKWSPSNNTTVYIHPHQVRRHAIFQVYLEELFRVSKADRESLKKVIKATGVRLKSSKFGVPDTETESSLLANLCYLLKEIHDMRNGAHSQIHHLVMNFPHSVMPQQPGQIYVWKASHGIDANLPSGIKLDPPGFQRVDVLAFQGKSFVDF